MIAIAGHHGCEVAFVPLTEIQVIVLFVLGVDPLIESLVHNEEAHTVAEVEKLRCWRVVRCADGIAAAAFQNLQSALPHTLGYGSTHGTAIVVQVHALHLHLLPIEQETLVQWVLDGTDAQHQALALGQC